LTQPPDRAQEHAALLLRKAAQDEFTVEKLSPDPAAPDEVIGFHAQQAVEKLLKAALAAASVRYEFTHQLGSLVDVVRGAGLEFPDDLADIHLLTPFATAFRYDDLPDEQEAPFDRAWALDLVRRMRHWAERTVRSLAEPATA
jgi:HEPN domain-containing protein